MKKHEPCKYNPNIAVQCVYCKPEIPHNDPDCIGAEYNDCQCNVCSQIRADISRGEHEAENAWLRHAEQGDSESQADLELHSRYFPGEYR